MNRHNTTDKVFDNKPLVWTSCVMLIFCIVVSSDVFAVNNPAGSGTAVPTHTRSGLVRNPNPIDTSSNLAVTGNVSDGRYFRGIVPYRATSDFGAPLGSTSIDSFLRDSAGAEDFGRYSGTARPYYSPTGTVTSTIPGQSGVIRAPSYGYSHDTSGKLVIPSGRLDLSSQSRILSYGGGTAVGELQTGGITTAPYVGSFADKVSVTRLLSRSSSQLEEIISKELSIYSRPGQSEFAAEQAGQQYEVQLERFRRDLKRATSEAADTKEQQQLENGTSELGSLKSKLSDEIRQPTLRKESIGQQDIIQKTELLQDKTKQQQISQQRSQLDLQLEAYKQAEQEIEDLIKKSTEMPGDIEDQMQLQSRTSEQLEELIRRSKEVLGTPYGEKQEKFYTDSPGDSLRRKEIEQEAAEQELSELERTIKAQSIMAKESDEIMDFRSFIRAKYKKYMIAGEVYLKKGRYYRAADAYTLASVYQPDDALAYAGKSYSLFAAGEYISSALFLSRALVLMPELPYYSVRSPQDDKIDKEAEPAYKPQRTDILSMVGDRDLLETRIVDVEKRLEESDVGELYFLLSYIYYQMERAEQALGAVNKASEMMPQSEAVAIVRRAIESAGNSD
ncbi:MAG: hypothetical protein JXB29_06785 [Sedimentisphaerales bacterium]|nr:hypothetical protein [Sedimentisphaerales bacterium]